MSPKPDISCRLLGPLRRTAQAHGATGLLSGLVAGPRLADPQQAQDEEAWLPVERYLMALSSLASMAQLDQPARRVGQAVRPADLGLWHYLVIASDTLGEGLTRGAQWLPLLFRGLGQRLHRQADAAGQAALEFEGPWPDALLELWIAALLGPLREQAQPAPRAIWLMRATRPGEAPWFNSCDDRVAVRHGAPRNALWLPARDLDRPRAGADPDVVRLLLPAAERRLTRGDRHGPWTERVEQTVAADLQARAPDLSTIARALGDSRATLTRRLAEEGESFRAISDRVRAAAAKRQLREGRLSISEIAFGLGFANTAAFHRAFKRWTAKSPGSFRRDHG